MAFSIRYLVPYMATIKGLDVGSGKPISNIHYLRCGLQTVSPPTYGAPIPGASSTATLLTALEVNWLSHIVPRLNANYQYQSTQMVALIGKRYGTPINSIFSLATGTPCVLSSPVPHGLQTGDQVLISGVTSPSGINGTWSIDYTTSTIFSLRGSSFVGMWSADGTWQKAKGALEWLTADLEQHNGTGQPGGVTGDALPLYCTASIRRLNGGIGRHFRSRFSLSPMSEIDTLDGGFTTTQKGLMVTALSTFNINMANGGSDANSGQSFFVVVSKALAMGYLSPFASNGAWCTAVASMVQQRNSGSLVRRKPKLTQIIT